jgi:hypothetical protein
LAPRTVSAAPWRSLADRSHAPPDPRKPMRLEIFPAPSEEEVAAIVAALEVSWPKPSVVESVRAVRVPRWRFSNRWWIAPLPTRRERPRR